MLLPKPAVEPESPGGMKPCQASGCSLHSAEIEGHQLCLPHLLGQFPHAVLALGEERLRQLRDQSKLYGVITSAQIEQVKNPAEGKVQEPEPPEPPQTFEEFRQRTADAEERKERLAKEKKRKQWWQLHRKKS